VAQSVLEGWRAGGSLAHENENRGRCALADEIAMLSFENIRNFYLKAAVAEGFTPETNQ
jgi:hypothetical protein